LVVLVLIVVAALAFIVARERRRPAAPVVQAVPPPVAVARRQRVPDRGPDRPAQRASATPTKPDLAIDQASPNDLLETARAMLARGEPLESIITLLEYVAATKPETAIELARSIARDDGERQVLLYAVVSDWAQRDPRNAAAWAFRIGDRYDVPGRASLLYLVLEQTANDDPASVLAAAEGALRNQAPLAASVKASDVARLTIEALVKSGRNELVQETVRRWQQGPESAALDHTVFDVAAMSLAQSSFTTAGQWLQSLPASPARNESFGNLAAAWSQQDPAGAMDWALTLNPADGGEDVRVATFQRWAQTDPDAAQHWLAAHPTPSTPRLLALLRG
jgi:hypothetical protein